MTPFPPIDRTSASFKNDLDVLFLTRMPNLINEVNAFQGNLNSLAAGGAYALVYRNVNNLISNGGPNGGVLSIAATQILVDTKDVSGFAVGGILEDFNSSTNPVKGAIRIQKVGDPSVWATFNVTLYSRNGGGLYGAIDCRITASSNGAQFGENALVMLFFQRTGDKGDQGSAFIPQQAKFSDRKSAGIAGGTNVTNDLTQIRTLNTSEYNNITGATLSANQIFLPPGVYEVMGRVPAYATGQHRGFLWNITDGIFQIYGSNAYSATTSSSSPTQSDSLLSGSFSLSTGKTFSVRHYTAFGGGTTGLGQPTNVAGILELYTEIIIKKIG